MTDLETRASDGAHFPVDAWDLRRAAAVIIACVALFVWAPTLRTVFGPMGAVVPVLHETFNDGSIAPPQNADITGYIPGLDGWCLAPGASGTLIYRFTSPPQTLIVNLWFYLPPKGTNALSVSTDGGQHYQRILENTSRAGDRIDLGIHPQAGEVWLRFDAVNSGDSLALVVDDLRVSYRTHPPPVLPERREVAAIVVSFGLVIVVLCRRWGLALSTVLILAVGAALRFEAAARLVDTALDPDAINYRLYGDAMQLFGEHGFFSARFSVREPFFIFAAHVYARLFGSSDFGLRLLTVILSTASIYAVLRVGRGLFGAIPGQVIGLGVALNGPLILESPRGLRLELEILLCMAYVGLAFLRRWPKAWHAAVALSLVGGLLVLTRSTYLPVVLALDAYALYRIGGGVRRWATGMVVTAGILAAWVVPHRYNMYRLHGDPFFDMAMYARWNANMEFAGRPGFLPMAQLYQNAYVGPPISYGHYMFGLHTPTEVAFGTAKGYWKLYRRMEMCAAPGWNPGASSCAKADVALQILAAIGFVMALAARRHLWIPLTFVLLEFSVAFVYDRHLVEPYRHSYSSFPLVLFAAVLPFVTLWTAIRRRQRPEVGEPPATRAA